MKMTFPPGIHFQPNCATGGYVYRGSSLTQGLYFLPIIVQSNRNNNSRELEFHGTFGAGGNSFGEDVNGELYIGSFNGGRIYTRKHGFGRGFHSRTFTMYPNPASDFLQHRA